MCMVSRALVTFFYKYPDDFYNLVAVQNAFSTDSASILERIVRYARRGSCGQRLVLRGVNYKCIAFMNIIKHRTMLWGWGWLTH